MKRLLSATLLALFIFSSSSLLAMINFIYDPTFGLQLQNEQTDEHCPLDLQIQLNAPQSPEIKNEFRLIEFSKKVLAWANEDGEEKMIVMIMKNAHNKGFCHQFDTQQINLAFQWLTEYSLNETLFLFLTKPFLSKLLTKNTIQMTLEIAIFKNNKNMVFMMMQNKEIKGNLNKELLITTANQTKNLEIKNIIEQYASR